MHEMTAETAAKLFLAHEEALEHAAAKIYRLLTQDAGLTPAECFVVCLRAAAKFLAQHDKNEWREIIQHASELLLQHAASYEQNVVAIAPTPNKAPSRLRPGTPGGRGSGGDRKKVAEGKPVSGRARLPSDEITELIQRSAEADAALMRGDIDR